MGAQEIESDVDGEIADADEFGLFTIPGYRYTCPYPDCGLQFKRKDQLDSHEYVHTKRKKYKCTENNCDKSYVNNAHLQRHIRSVHRSNKGTAADVPSKIESSASDAKMLHNYQRAHIKAPRSYYRCDYCSEEFYRKFHLRLHIVTHTGHYAYKCVQCDMGFIRMSYLKRHEKTHKSRKCDHCDAVFLKWSQLVAHKHKEHVITEWKCMQCNRVFHSRRGLKYHQQVHVETEERTVFQCDFDKCPKFFFHRNNLTAHRKSKHGNQKFVCSVSGCERELTTKQKLDLHMRAIHSSDGKKIMTDVSKAKVRAPRKDKGVQKTSTAAKLLNLIAPKEIEKAIIAGHGDSVFFHYDHDENDASDELSSSDKCSAVNTQSQMMEMVQA